MAGFFGKRIKDEELMENINVGQRLSKTGFFTHDLVKDKLIMTSQVYNILCMESHDNIYNVIHDEGQKAFFEHEEMSYEMTLEGQEKHLQVWTRTVFDKEKRPVKISGALQDITDRKLIENNLKAIGEDLSIAQKVSGVGSWRYDVLKDEFYGTEEMFSIYGIKPEEFDNDFESTIKLIHPDDRDNVRHCLAEHFAGRSCEIEFRIPQKDGSVKYVKGKGEAILNELGQTVSVIGTLRDITQEKLLQMQLEQSNRMMEQGQKLAKTGSWVFDIATNKSTSSKGVYRIFGIDPENFDNTYESYVSLVHYEDRDRVDKLLGARLKGPFEMKFRIVRPDGEVRFIHQVSEYVFDENENPVYLYGVIRDITKEKKLNEELEKRQEEIAGLKNSFQMLLQESSDVYEIIKPDGTIVYISEAVEKVLGSKPEDRLGKNVYDFYEGEELEKVRNFINSVVENPGVRLKGDVKLRLKDGKELNIEAELQNLMDNPFIEGIVIHFRDISDRVEMKNKLTYISTHDDLTKLPNQSYFKEQLKSYCSEVKDTKMPFALMFISISGLSYVIYTLGYSIEQLLVLEIVKRLKELFNDNFIARYSEDDFAVVLKSQEEDYESLAKRIINTLTKPYKIQQYELTVSVNVGINFFADCNKDVDSFVQDTLQTVLRAKREGKNRYRFYSSSFDIQNFKDFFFRNDLRKAIETDQLSVRYQPIVNIWSGEILFVEALVRWEHPEWGLISPGEFIAIAEEMGLIIDVGNWMLNKVCQDIKKWMEKGIENVDVAVNFSPLQFLQKDFVDNIIGIISKYGVDPSFLTVEVTESVLIDRTDKVCNDINRLKSYGVKVALDDFGTGYSSLSYLDSLELDIIKIDGSFVKKAVNDKRSLSIIKSVIGLGKELGIRVVAEGIENWQQLEMLRQLNCFAGQGYLYTKPVVLEEIIKLLIIGRCNPQMEEEAKPFVERRKFFRVRFDVHLVADMTIVEVKGRKVSVGKTKVLVKNMGPGGLCFISDIKLPVERDLVLSFSTELMGNTLVLLGYTVWSNELQDNLYEYGIEFIIDENTRTELTRVLNQVQIRMRKTVIFTEGSFTTYNPYTFFKKLKDSED